MFPVVEISKVAGFNLHGIVLVHSRSEQTMADGLDVDTEAVDAAAGEISDQGMQVNAPTGGRVVHRRHR